MFITKYIIFLEVIVYVFMDYEYINYRPRLLLLLLLSQLYCVAAVTVL